MPITIGALRESAPGETRVSLVPEVVDKFVAAGARVVLEPGAGIRAQFPDALYKKGEWLAGSAAVLSQADVLLTVAPLTGLFAQSITARATTPFAGSCVSLRPNCTSRSNVVFASSSSGTLVKSKASGFGGYSRTVR